MKNSKAKTGLVKKADVFKFNRKLQTDPPIVTDPTVVITTTLTHILPRR